MTIKTILNCEMSGVATRVAIGMAAFLSGSALFINQAAVADPYINQVRNQLIEAAGILLEGNYSLTHTPYVGDLSDSHTDLLTLNLRSGITYQFVGVCDEDCSDLDLALYDGNGNLIDSDTAYNDIPLVSVTPRWNQQFRLKIDMADCSASYCNYGVGTFGR